MDIRWAEQVLRAVSVGLPRFLEISGSGLPFPLVGPKPPGYRDEHLNCEPRT